MEIILEEQQYNNILHDLTAISTYLGKTSSYFDENGMKHCQTRLSQIKEELRQCTKDE